MYVPVAHVMKMVPLSAMQCQAALGAAARKALTYTMQEELQRMNRDLGLYCCRMCSQRLAACLLPIMWQPCRRVSCYLPG